MIFADQMHLFGAEGPQGGLVSDFTDWKDLTLPVVTLALVTFALFSRYMRSAVLDNITEDYVRTARAKGASERRVLIRHVLRNSLIPIATLVGLNIPLIVAGALITEPFSTTRVWGTCSSRLRSSRTTPSSSASWSWSRSRPSSGHCWPTSRTRCSIPV